MIRNYTEAQREADRIRARKRYWDKNMEAIKAKEGNSKKR